MFDAKKQLAVNYQRSTSGSNARETQNPSETKAKQRLAYHLLLQPHRAGGPGPESGPTKRGFEGSVCGSRGRLGSDASHPRGHGPHARAGHAGQRGVVHHA